MQILSLDGVRLFLVTMTKLYEYKFVLVLWGEELKINTKMKFLHITSLNVPSKSC